MAESAACRMSVATLAKIFAPMVIGHPYRAMEGLEKLQNVKEQHKVRRYLALLLGQLFCHPETVQF